MGDLVEFSADPQFTQASDVRLSTATDSAGGTTSLLKDPAATPGLPAAPNKPASDQIAAAEKPSSAAKPAPAARAKKLSAEEAAFRVEAKNQCLFVVRYQRIAPGHLARVGTLPQIETYTSDISASYREPQLTLVTSDRAAVRVYDEQAVELERVTELLGNFSVAQTRCDKLLLERFPGDRIAGELGPLPTW